MTPLLLPPGISPIFQSNLKSKSVNFSFVMMSGGCLTFTSESVPSMTPQFSGIVSILKPRHLSMVWPSKRSLQPSFTSAAVRLFGRGAWAPGAAAATAMAAAPGVQAPRPNSLTAAEVKEGWRLLFDGQTIDKWRGFKMETMPENWGVIDGTLSLVNVRQPPDIITKEKFTDFDFKFDWKIGEIPGGSNSGVMFYVTEEGGATYHSGPEYQILDNARHPDGKNPLTTAASCYAILPPVRDVT